MKALIIEDEPRAQKNMENLLSSHFPDISVIGITDSVKSSLAWLSEHTGAEGPDIIFMDVELLDGDCFQILEKADIKAHVIMTTAYDNYAVKAFEVNSLDYLLKPIEVESLRRAVARARTASQDRPETVHPPQAIKQKFLIRLNDRIVPVSARSIAYFYSEAKNTYIVTVEGTTYVLDDSLDTLEQSLDRTKFFRISRSCIVAENAIESVLKLLGGRLRLTLKKDIATYTDLTVSRARTEPFLSWLEK